MCFVNIFNSNSVNILVRLLALSLSVLLLFFQTGLSHAHAPNENYVWLNVEDNHLSGRFEVNINDLNTYLNINVDDLSAERLEGVKLAAPSVHAYVEQHLTFSEANQQLTIQWETPTILEEIPDYLQFNFKIDPTPASNKITINNTLFMDPDGIHFNKLHRSLLVYEYNRKIGKEFGSENTAIVFKHGQPEFELDLTNPQSILAWKDFLWQGVLHIVYGIDHVLFIIVLLLTSVLASVNRTWTPLPSFKPAFINTLKIITLFTIAHSITLSLAALELVSLNSALVESVIAFSIIAIALNNIKPLYNTHAWLLVFLFGLFHGLGFASVMGDLQFRTVLLERILIMFNVGVELGQLAIVVIAFPLLFMLRKWAYYHRGIVTPLSLGSIVVASFWLLQRTGIIA